ncbi:hypothetical protein ACS0TY_009783 [Phlomoides rotata]
MGDKGDESRFVCKLCNKKFPCGKSLGGHMRSHVVANSAEFHEKVEFNQKRGSSFLEDETKLGETGYGLREKPKKTRRVVDSKLPLPPDQVCKQCGKGFQSLKALCGHMACHSEKDKGTKDDHSWSSENDEKMVLDSESDKESEEMKLRSRSPKSKGYKKIADGSSSISEIDFVQGPEDAAMCLLWMSRDVSWNNCVVDSVVESSDNNSVVLEPKSSSIEIRVGKREILIECMKPEEGILGAENEERESSDSGYYLEECGKDESDASGGGAWKSSKMIMSSIDEYDHDGMASRFGGTASRKRKYGSEYHESARMMKNAGPSGEMCSKSKKKSKYECFNCKKVFKSYQALGGHRPCHKRLNESPNGSGENNPDDSLTYDKKPSGKNSSRYTEKNSSTKKNKEQACPHCHKVFKNGQALGGHKRTHFIGGHDENNNRSPVAKPMVPDLLDLNLPAPEANDNEDD